VGNTWLQSTSMSKRFPNRAFPLTSHRLKRTRRESPSTRIQSRMISDHTLKILHENLGNIWKPSERPSEDSIQLQMIYCYCGPSILEDGRKIIDLSEFMAQVQKNDITRTHFLEMSKEVAISPFNRERLVALLSHSMCLCYGMDQFMNITQRHSGLHPTRSLRVGLPCPYEAYNAYHLYYSRRF
jgi:hypothetical protein